MFFRLPITLLSVALSCSLHAQEEPSIEELIAEGDRRDAALRAEGAFTAKPIYDAVIPQSDATKWHQPAKLSKEQIDSLSSHVQGFYQRYNSMDREKMLADPELSKFLTAEFITILQRRAIAKMLIGGYVTFPGLTEYADLYKFYGAMSGPRPGYYLTDFAIGWTKGEEMVYESHMWVILKLENGIWRIDDLRDMGNG
jgi:hypothetical protein